MSGSFSGQPLLDTAGLPLFDTSGYPLLDTIFAAPGAAVVIDFTYQTLLDSAGQPLLDTDGLPLLDTIAVELFALPSAPPPPFGPQSDIAIVWDNRLGRGDWAMAGPDLKSGSDLESAILVSLFTDRRAPPDYVAPPPTPQDLRGWWGDTYTGYQIGSGFWMYARAVKTQKTLNLIQQDAQLSLAWLIECGAVASFDITAQWVNRTMVGLSIVVHKPPGAGMPGVPLSFRYAWLWGQIS